MPIELISLRKMHTIPDGAYRILVTRCYPFYIKGIKDKIDEWVSILAPKKELFESYKNELKRTKSPKLAWNLARFDTYFRFNILHNSNTMAEIKRIRDLSRSGKVIYLISHEVEDEYSHRRILKELMEKYNL